MTYSLTTDIDYNKSKTLIIDWASKHGCTLTNFQENGPGGGNHVCTFISNNYNNIKELTQILNISPLKIMEKKW